jgi:hypothetical protein
MKKCKCVVIYKHKDIIQTYICQLLVSPNMGDEKNSKYGFLITKELFMLIIDVDNYNLPTLLHTIRTLLDYHSNEFIWEA